MSITIFTTPKAFEGQTKIDQYNAVISWKKFTPNAQIILIGKDFGTRECAEDLHVEHIEKCKSNELGTPFLDSIFTKAEENSNHDILMYINSDIVFTHDISNMITIFMNELSYKQNFLATGQRHDTDIKFQLKSHQSLSEIKDYLDDIKIGSEIHGPAGLDYFIFRKSSFSLPPFLIGRPCWDNWLIWHCYKENFMIINTTNAFEILHQNHDYSHSKTGGAGRVLGPEWDYNVKVAGGYANQENLKCQTHYLDNNHIKARSKKSRLLYKIYSKIFGRTLLALIRYNRYLLKNRL